MKKYLMIILILGLTVSLTSCGLFNRKAKCPAYENVHTETRSDGSFKKSKSKSHLFPKKMRKKKKK